MRQLAPLRAKPARHQAGDVLRLRAIGADLVVDDIGHVALFLAGDEAAEHDGQAAVSASAMVPGPALVTMQSRAAIHSAMLST